MDQPPAHMDRPPATLGVHDADTVISLVAIQRLDATIPAQLLKDADPNPDARSRLDEILLPRASPQPRKIFGVAVNYRSPASAMPHRPARCYAANSGR